MCDLVSQRFDKVATTTLPSSRASLNFIYITVMSENILFLYQKCFAVRLVGKVRAELKIVNLAVADRNWEFDFFEF